jgi:hypothetical protein
MKSIKFSESELEFLLNHYELELLDAENYIGEIKNILKKLGKIEKESTKEKPIKKTGKQRGRPKKVQKVTAGAAAIVPVKPDNSLKPAKKTTAVKAAKGKAKAIKSVSGSIPVEASKA